MPASVFNLHALRCPALTSHRSRCSRLGWSASSGSSRPRPQHLWHVHDLQRPGFITGGQTSAGPLHATAGMQASVLFQQGGSSNSSRRHPVSVSPFGLVVVDFDDTCTAKDTIGLLMTAAVQARQAITGTRASTGQPQQPDAAAAAGATVQDASGAGADADDDLPAVLAANYVAQQRALLSEILPPEEQSPAPSGNTSASQGSVSQSFDSEGLASFLSRLSDFDLRMNQVAMERGAIAGLTTVELKAAVSRAQLRPGCRDFLIACRDAGVPFHVLSVNWSADLVSAVLDVGLQAATEADLVAGIHAEQHAPAQGQAGAGLGEGGRWTHRPLLLANRLELGPDGVATGRWQGVVQCARDKGRLFNLLQQQLNAGHLHTSPSGADVAVGRPGLSLYVGDSASDLPALLQADLGVVIGENALLRRVARAFNITLLPLSQAPHRPAAASSGARGVLYTTSSWTEIANFVLGQHSASSTADSSSQAADPHRAASAHPGTSSSRSDTSAFVTGVSSAASTLPHSAAGYGPSPPVPRVLVVAGSDSGGGAGIQADLKAVMACGAFGTTAITALTAQNTHGVHGVHAVPLEFLQHQMDVVLGDIGADVIKTGMLPSADAVKVVADKVKQYGVKALVVDPVMVSTSGHALTETSVPGALLRYLAPLATLLTPNLPEASTLLGGMKIESVDDMEEAARKLQQLTGCKAVLVKGGHLAPAAPVSSSSPSTSADGSAEGSPMVDVLFDGTEVLRIAMPRLTTGNTHGTGCTLASAISAGLAKGLPLSQAVREARAYLHSALGRSAPLAIGTGVQRPFNHGFMLADWTVTPANQGAGTTIPSTYLDRARVRSALRLYAVTDPRCNEACGRTMAEAVREAVRGGATIVQIREKDVDGGDFLATARAAYEVCRAAGVPLIINDRVDVALATGPDVGVHVGQDDIPAADVRRLLGPHRILGVSVKCVEQARAAIRNGADYLGCGAVFPTSTKDSGVIGLEGLAAVCSEAGDVPVVSIGGVSAANAASTIAAGASGAAVVSAIFGAADCAGATRELRAVVDVALAQH